MKSIYRILKWVKEEIILVIPAVTFFVLTFNLIYFTVGLSMGPHEIRYLTPLEVTLLGIIIGKVLLLLQAFPFINLSQRTPLIWQILWKFLICSFFIFVFTMFDFVMKLTDHWHSFSLGVQHVKTDMSSPIFWGTELWILTTFFIYVVFSEFAYRLGKDRVMTMLFKENK